MFWEEKLGIPRRFLQDEHGIASDKTLQRLFDLLASPSFAACFAAWVAALTGRVKGWLRLTAKTMRGARQPGEHEKALHGLAACAHAARLLTGQRCVDGKSNEITAMPPLPETLPIAGTVVAIDAMGSQEAVAQAILNNKADYIPALKGGQSALLHDVRRRKVKTPLTAS